MSAHVRVMARRLPSSAPVSPFAYHAQVFDDGDRHGSAIWVCEHEHATAVEAHQCGAQWVQRVAYMLNRDEARAPTGERPRRSTLADSG